MVGSLERIEQDIAALDQATSALADQLHSAYLSYLKILGTAVRQQLIMACYHICTQGYPQQFLALSYSQRQQLQQSLRSLGQQVQEELLDQLYPPVPLDKPEQIPAQLPSLDLFDQASPPASDPITLAGDSSSSRSLTPADLIFWQETLEQEIVHVLRTASHAANRLLQQANVLPKKLPEPILESAAKTEMAEVGGTTPNLLNLLVETVGDKTSDQDNSEGTKEPPIMHIIAIHLRLAEIEFSEAAVTVARNKIRGLISQLKSLGREYQKKQRERAIASAQAAWRACWTED